MIPRIGLFGIKAGVQLHGDSRMIQYPRDHLGIAVTRHALKFVKEIVVVIGKAHGQPLQDRGRQIMGRAAPLLGCVAFEKRLVEIAPDKSERLLLKGLRIGDILGLAGEKGTGLVRAQGLAVELIDCMQVDGEREYLPLCCGFDPVFIGFKGRELVHILPDLRIIGVENMRPVGVHHHTRFSIACGVAIACNMVAAINNGDIMTCLRQSTAYHRPRKPSPYHQNCVAHLCPIHQSGDLYHTGPLLKPSNPRSISGAYLLVDV